MYRPAQFMMGVYYENGTGIPQDFVEAHKWYNLAEAQAERDSLAGKMTGEQIAEAQELARGFKPRKEGSNNSTSLENPTASGSGFFVTDDGYLISNYHIVKDAVQVRLVTSAGTISAKVVQVDAANDLSRLAG